MRYTHLNSDTAKTEVVKIGNNLANYLFDKKINNIIFVDRSARPGYIALTKSWKNKFPNIPRPNIYFTNPDGYNTNNRTNNQITKEFNETYKKLSANKDERIMVFDVCMHTGETINPLINFLEKNGYKNVFLGLTQPKDSDCETKNNFSALDHEPYYCCYPFDRDYSIEKSRTSILSERTRNSGDRRDAIQLRKEISSLF